MTTEQAQKIRTDLQVLAQRAKPIFGSESHRYLLHPTLTPRALQAIEQTHSISLPQDYRLFLETVGNGAVGPYHGLFAFGYLDDGKWEEGDGLVGTLAKPFPDSTEWNAREGMPGEELLESNPAEYEVEMDAFDARYWHALDGAFPICHLGCALRHCLVVTGPEAGYVWADHRAEDAGLFPLTNADGSRVTFYIWYRSWLDEALTETDT